MTDTRNRIIHTVKISNEKTTPSPKNQSQSVVIQFDIIHYLNSYKWANNNIKKMISHRH